MKITGEEMMKKINGILEDHGQTILVVKWSGKEIEFNNGATFKNNDREKFIRRIFNTKTDLWKKFHDEVMISSEKVKEIKSYLASLGGIECQKTHGEKIKDNLNTGTPWNKGKVTGKIPWNLNKTKEVDDRLMKLSLERMNLGNPMYGKKYSDENKNELSTKIKSLILSGEFTPNSNNRNTHWDSYYNNKKYRSSWEALYQSFNEDAEYEKLRIKYLIDDIEKIYIVDFIDYTNRLVIEVKPSSQCSDIKFKQKLKSLKKWAEQNNFTVVVVTEEWFWNQNENIIQYDKFDEHTKLKIETLYEIGKKKRNTKAE